MQNRINDSEEEIKCARPGCGQFFKPETACTGLNNFRYCSEKCRDFWYKEIGIYELIKRKQD